MPLLRAQGPPGGGHAHPLERAAQPLLQPVRNGPGHTGHLVDVLDLAVQHGPAAMLLLFNGQHLQPLAHHPARNADDAAGTDVQRENQVRVLHLHFLRHFPHLFQLFRFPIRRAANRAAAGFVSKDL
jgi:hypothetical protein